MGIERDQPDLLERQPQRMDAGTGHRIVAADHRVSACARDACRAQPSRIGGVASSMFMPVDRDVAMIGDAARQLAAGLDVVAPDPPQRRAQQAGARSQRPGVTDPQPERRPTSPTGARRPHDDQVGKIGPAACA